MLFFTPIRKELLLKYKNISYLTGIVYSVYHLITNNQLEGAEFVGHDQPRTDTD